jgi:hypothetical protein
VLGHFVVDMFGDGEREYAGDGWVKWRGNLKEIYPSLTRLYRKVNMFHYDGLTMFDQC